jgi:hypothetical protein
MDIAAILALSIPIVAILGGYWVKIVEIRSRQGNVLSEEVRNELREMKSQLAQLRETTTKFDLSFDAAITRLEDRVDQIERRQGVAARAGDEAQIPLRPGRGAL